MTADQIRENRILKGHQGFLLIKMPESPYSKVFCHGKDERLWNFDNLMSNSSLLSCFGILIT